MMMRAKFSAIGAAAALLLAGAALAWQPVAAGGNGGQQTRIGQLQVSPQISITPITADSPLHVCISGLSEGNVALVLVPYIGTVGSHSNLTYRYVIDSSGGVCFDAPPTWAKLDLQPGTYTVSMSWSKNDSSKQHDGPTAQFSVTAS